MFLVVVETAIDLGFYYQISELWIEKNLFEVIKPSMKRTQIKEFSDILQEYLVIRPISERKNKAKYKRFVQILSIT